jgi:diguanylate cyclase (GGDEF)-like protein
MSTAAATLLVVDDEALNRDMLARRLTRSGYSVDVAEDGTSALALIEQHGYDLVLLDQMMPDISGAEVLRRLRTKWTAGELPVIMVTAVNAAESIAQALELGANDYITKPLDFQVARARIRSQLARRAEDVELRDREQRLALALQGGNQAVWDWDLVQKRMHYSPLWVSMAGYDAGAIRPDPEEWLSRVHPDDRPHVEEALAAHLESRSRGFDVEYRLRCQDGGYRWMRACGVALRNSEGLATRLTGSQSDINLSKTLDPLTNLPNRLHFGERLVNALRKIKQNPEGRFAVLFLDLDRFKVINDSLGHLAGDQLLIGLAERLRRVVRSEDAVSRQLDETLARFGGDEFAILVENLREDSNATVIAERIQRELAEPLPIMGRDVFASISIGIAIGSPDYASAEEIIRDADTAMYRAKSSGRACYQVFDGAMRREAVARLELESDLRGALERKEFVLHYQPSVVLATGEFNGFEALVRWQHPSRGLLPPDDFIPVAEEVGLIVPLGYWIIGEGCRQLMEWQAAHPELKRCVLSVNVSVRELQEPEFPRQVLELLEKSGLAPECLSLEITESVLVQDYAPIRDMLGKLKNLKLGLRLDDFGTGYSSLKYLQKLPFDTLKIDRSFVEYLNSPGRNVDLVRAIVLMASGLGLDVIAEGVETAEQRSQLQLLGCGFGQGYFFSRPLTPADAEEFISQATVCGPSACS